MKDVGVNGPEKRIPHAWSLRDGAPAQSGAPGVWGCGCGAGRPGPGGCPEAWREGRPRVSAGLLLGRSALHAPACRLSRTSCSEGCLLPGAGFPGALMSLPVPLPIWQQAWGAAFPRLPRAVCTDGARMPSSRGPGWRGSGLRGCSQVLKSPLLIQAPWMLPALPMRRVQVLGASRPPSSSSVGWGWELGLCGPSLTLSCLAAPRLSPGSVVCDLP